MCIPRNNSTTPVSRRGLQSSKDKDDISKNNGRRKRSGNNETRTDYGQNVGQSTPMMKKRRAMIMMIQGMIQLKFPEIERERCVRISKALEYRLWLTAKQEHDDYEEEVLLDIYSDTQTVQKRLRTIVTNLKESDGV